MNVIISQDKSVRLTQQSNSAYNIQNIVFYISKALTYSDVCLNLTKVRNVYPFYLENTSELANYQVYKVIFTQSVSLSQREYDVSVMLDDEEIFISTLLIQPIEYTAPIARFALNRSGEASGGVYGLMDSHEPIEIVDRDIIITNNQNVLIAEDNISQCITFRMSRYYEGIDLRTKDIYFDYVTKEDGQDLLCNIKLTNLGNANENDYIQLENINGIEYMLIPFAVPYAVVKSARTVPFALSAVDPEGMKTIDEKTGHGTGYVWQTKPSSLIVQPNLFKRNSVPQDDPTIPEADEIMETLRALTDTTEQLTEAVEEIQESDIYNLDDDSADGVVNLGGGGAE